MLPLWKYCNMQIPGRQSRVARRELPKGSIVSCFGAVITYLQGDFDFHLNFYMQYGEL